MIKPEEIKEILRTYKKYGWTFKKAILTDELKASLTADDIENLFKDKLISSSTVDGVWFVRNSKNNKEAWELRHLNSNPFALFELIDIDSSESEKEDILINLENRLKEYASKQTGMRDH